MCVCVCVNVLQNLLELEELKPASPSPSPSASASSTVRLDGVSLSWSEDREKKVISGVSFSLDEVRQERERGDNF